MCHTADEGVIVVLMCAGWRTFFLQCKIETDRARLSGTGRNRLPPQTGYRGRLTTGFWFLSGVDTQLSTPNSSPNHASYFALAISFTEGTLTTDNFAPVGLRLLLKSFSWGLGIARGDSKHDALLQANVGAGTRLVGHGLSCRMAT